MSVLEVMYIHNICGTTECGMESLTSQKGSLDFSEVVQGELMVEVTEIRYHPGKCSI